MKPAGKTAGLMLGDIRNTATIEVVEDMLIPSSSVSCMGGLLAPMPEDGPAHHDVVDRVDRASASDIKVRVPEQA